MKTKSSSTVALAAAITISFGVSSGAGAANFADPDSIAYSKQLWAAMTQANLAGADAITSRPYAGTHPHGAVLDTIEGTVSVGGHAGRVIAKRNYGGEGVTVASVMNNPRKNLGAVTVMFKREAGYDSDNKDWFWAKFKADGSLHKNPKGMLLAGRVAKGKPAGCIACHKAAPGGDLVFTSDR